jgi:hypothetical protein
VTALTRSIYTDITAIVAVAALIIVTFVWSEARKEAIYLCNNFHIGVSKESVLRQLNTANLLTINETEIPSGTKVVARLRELCNLVLNKIRP